MEQGLIVSLQFTVFDIYPPFATCTRDHLTITDGDGTILMEKSCGSSSEGNALIEGQSMGSALPANIKSRSNVVKLVFITSAVNSRSGWSVSWSAVTPGKEIPI